jgi:hypothetical protein
MRHSTFNSYELASLYLNQMMLLQCQQMDVPKERKECRHVFPLGGFREFVRLWKKKPRKSCTFVGSRKYKYKYQEVPELHSLFVSRSKEVVIRELQVLSSLHIFLCSFVQFFLGEKETRGFGFDKQFICIDPGGD